MDTSYLVDSADRVRSCIANLFLAYEEVQAAVGRITLASHQLEAVARIRLAFDEFGGALLCDAVGAGKTFVALAVAREAHNPVIVAPAGLREMWTAAMHATRISASLISTESLSRNVTPVGGCDCLIVDEAHHFRNRATRRHRSLVMLIEDRPTLLVTATPIHNSRNDLVSLASLFLGGRAEHMTDAEMTRLIIRRARKNIPASVAIPDVADTEWWISGDDPDFVKAVMDLPPPIPCRDSGVADCLAALGLLRQWASSECAFATALKRRLARAIALETSLMAGEYPTARDLKSWISGDDSIQLGLPGLLPVLPVGAGVDQLLSAVRAHLDGLRGLSARLGGNRPIDDARVAKLRELMRSHPGQRIIAFASYEATVLAYFHRLRSLGHVAAMTARGGRVAGGALSRSEIEHQFSPDSPTTTNSERIDLLLTTDLMSEGVNLQRARIVVHLDIPWTSARMDQRIGRIARIGSPHTEVRAFGFLPPPSSERVLRINETVSRKWRVATNATGTDYDHRLPQTCVRTETPTTELHESLREFLRRWQSAALCEPRANIIVAAACASRSGFLAAVQDNGKPLLIAGTPDDISDSHRTVLRLMQEAEGGDVAFESEVAASALKRIDSWLTSRMTRSDAGLGDAGFIKSRRKLFARINSLAASVPQHLRGSREESMVRARRFASITHSAGRERLLTELGPAHNSLDLLADLDSRVSRRERDETGHRIRALLLLVEPTPVPAS